MSSSMITFVPPDRSTFAADEDRAMAETKSLFEYVFLYLRECGAHGQLNFHGFEETLLVALRVLWPDFRAHTFAFDPTALPGVPSGQTAEMPPAAPPQMFRRSAAAGAGYLALSLGCLIRYVFERLDESQSSRAAEVRWALKQFALKVDVVFDSKIFDQIQ